MMTKIFQPFFIVFLCCYTTVTFAQLDANKKSTKKGTNSFGFKASSAKEVSKPTSLGFESNDGFKNAHTKQQQKLKKQQAERNLENKGILTKAKIAEEQFLKSFKKINGLYQYPVIDQDLGSFSTKSNSVTIICRDYQYPDGDIVTIYVNDMPVISNLILKRNYQSFNLPLDKGINTIKIVALNQGSSGPNTAGFKIYNDAGILISSNEWNLATGAKASIIIAKQK